MLNLDQSVTHLTIRIDSNVLPAAERESARGTPRMQIYRQSIHRSPGTGRTRSAGRIPRDKTGSTNGTQHQGPDGIRRREASPGIGRHPAGRRHPGTNRNPGGGTRPRAERQSGWPNPPPRSHTGHHTSHGANPDRPSGAGFIVRGLYQS